MVITVEVPPFGEREEAQTQLNTWYVRPGQRVAAGDDLAELVTDKAAFSLPSPETGTVVALLAAEGAVVKEGAALLRLDVPAAPSAAGQKGGKR